MIRLAPWLLSTGCWVTGAEIATKLGTPDVPVDSEVAVETDDTEVSSETDDTEASSETDDTELARLPCADVDAGTRSGRVATGDLVGATNNHHARCVLSPGAVDVAVAWTAPVAGCWRLDTQGSTFDTVLTLFGECGGDALTCDDDGFDVTTGASAVTRRFALGESALAVIDALGPSGDWQLNATPTTQLVPDIDAGSAFGDQPMAAGDTTTSDTTLNPSDPADCPFPSGRDVLVRWVAPSAGRWRFELYSDFDASLALYGRCDARPRRCVDGEELFAPEVIEAYLFAGEDVVIRVAGFDPQLIDAYAGPFQLYVDLL